MASQLIAIVCEIQRGTYDEERVFSLAQVEGDPYVGLAPIGFFLTDCGKLLDSTEPAEGSKINGLVLARLVQNGGPTAWVSLPTGETVVVPASSIRHQRPNVEPKYVFVGS